MKKIIFILLVLTIIVGIVAIGVNLLRPKEKPKQIPKETVVEEDTEEEEEEFESDRSFAKDVIGRAFSKNGYSYEFATNEDLVVGVNGRYEAMKYEINEFKIKIIHKEDSVVYPFRLGKDFIEINNEIYKEGYSEISDDEELDLTDDEEIDEEEVIEDENDDDEEDEEEVDEEEEEE